MKVEKVEIVEIEDFKVQAARNVFFNPLIGIKTETETLLDIYKIELNEDFTRIDFIYEAPSKYVNGGWIQMEGNAYISPVGSSIKYRLIKTIGIPLTPLKHYFKNKGEFHTYSLIFPALPSDTKKIDIIEKLAPGSYFNFYGIDYSKWITVPHPADIAQSRN